MVNITIPCPKMGVHSTDIKGVMITDSLPCPDTSILFPNGDMIDFLLTFPQTFIRKKKWNRYMVDPCQTEDGNFRYQGDRGQLVLDLPEEPCDLVFWPWPPHMIARSILAKGRIIWATGVVWLAEVLFDDVPSWRQGKGFWQVDPTVAKGTAY